MHITKVSGNNTALEAVGLGSLEGKLPEGTLIVRNDSSEPIMTIVVKWTIPAKGNATRTQWLYLDGYYLPQPQPVLSSGSTALVTMHGMLGEEHFGKLAQNPMMHGSPLVNPFSEASVAEPGTAGTIDAVFFADGKIEGEDSSQYEQTILARHFTFLSLLSEFHESTSAADVKERAALIASEAPYNTSDSSALILRQTARAIERSSDPMAFLAALKEHTIPAKFYHSERKKTEGGSDETHQ
ncbi:MAG: hypothetical protein WB679_19260 [Terracidiphilus sp.]